MDIVADLWVTRAVADVLSVMDGTTLCGYSMDVIHTSRVGHICFEAAFAGRPPLLLCCSTLTGSMDWSTAANTF